MTHYPKISWYREGWIILVEYPAEYTEDDLEATVSAKPVLRMLDAGQGPLVHVIQDFSTLGAFQITRLTKLVQVNKQPGRVELYTHPKLGWIVDVTIPESPIRFLDAAIMNMFTGRYRAVDTIEQALDFLKQQDPNLPEF